VLQDSIEPTLWRGLSRGEQGLTATLGDATGPIVFGSSATLVRMCGRPMLSNGLILVRNQEYTYANAMNECLRPATLTSRLPLVNASANECVAARALGAAECTRRAGRPLSEGRLSGGRHASF
jgi:hypothetical protein